MLYKLVFLDKLGRTNKYKMYASEAAALNYFRFHLENERKYGSGWHHTLRLEDSNGVVVKEEAR